MAEPREAEAVKPTAKPAATPTDREPGPKAATPPSGERAGYARPPGRFRAVFLWSIGLVAAAAALGFVTHAP